MSGDTAWLLGPILPPVSQNTPRCFQFDYNMFGGGMGELNVYFYDKTSSTKNKYWSVKGDMGAPWRQGKVPVPVGTNLQVLF